MASYTVRQGDHMSKIALLYGFRDYQIIWDHPENADLKASRNPNVLFPGDIVFVPEKEQRTVGATTGKVHKFVVVTPPLRLRIVIRDFDNKLLINTGCVLKIEGKDYDLQTDGAGMIDVDIPASAETGTLSLPDLDMELPLRIGYLDPESENSGWRGRLVNLGYHAGPTGDDAVDELRLHYAVEEFQSDYQLKITGEIDDSTKAKLREVHGC